MASVHHFHEFDLEVQGLAGELVVGVQGDAAFVLRRDADGEAPVAGLQQDPCLLTGKKQFLFMFYSFFRCRKFNKKVRNSKMNECFFLIFCVFSCMIEKIYLPLHLLNLQLIYFVCISRPILLHYSSAWQGC